MKSLFLLAFCTAILATIAAAATSAADESDKPKPYVLKLRRSVTESQGDKKTSKHVTEQTEWDPKKTAVIICDMWDDHWCKGAAARVVEMAPEMNKVVAEARRRASLIIHAPSTCVDFYKDTPQRKRAKNAPFAKTPVPLETRERWGTAWCWPDKKTEPELPIDDSDMGCDCQVKCKIEPPWKRQIATIEIKEPDAITDNGQETYNLLQERGIDNVVMMGVHLNMCVLGRPFGIRQLKKLGKNVVLVRDMTDTMYNSQMRPKVSHFAGTDLMVQHVEENFCPSITSADIVGGKPFQFRDHK